MASKRLKRTDQEWFDLIQNCRTSGLKINSWGEQLGELHTKGYLDSTIKELAVICAHNEEFHMDHLQTECYQRALTWLNYLRQLLTD